MHRRPRGQARRSLPTLRVSTPRLDRPDVRRQNNQFPPRLTYVDQQSSRGDAIYTIGGGQRGGRDRAPAGPRGPHGARRGDAQEDRDVTGGQVLNANTEADLRTVYEKPHHRARRSQREDRADRLRDARRRDPCRLRRVRSHCSGSTASVTEFASHNRVTPRVLSRARRGSCPGSGPARSAHPSPFATAHARSHGPLGHPRVASRPRRLPPAARSSLA